MATDTKKSLLFQAIKNNEFEIVKKLIEEDKLEFETLGQDVFEMSNNATVLGYVSDKEMMHFFVDKGLRPNIYDIIIIANGSVDTKSKLEVLDYYLNNYSDVTSTELKPKDMWDSLGSDYQVAKHINKDKALLTMMFFTSVKTANKNLYEYLKPKLKEINLNAQIPIRYESYDENVSEEKYYIIESITKNFSRKTADNELFIAELDGKKDKEKYIKDEESKNKKLLDWLEFLFEEGVSPFNSTLQSNFYFRTYPFSILVLNRETKLIKKAIELFGDDWDKYKQNVDLLKDILSYNGDSSNYYQRVKDPQVYIYPYKAKQRDEIIEFLAKNEFPFFKSSSFVNALMGKVYYSHEYTKYSFDINSELFWSILQNNTPQGDGTFTISHNSFSEEQNEILEKKAYAVDKNELLLKYIDSLKEYSSDDSDIVQKAQKLIDRGATLLDPMGILHKYSNYTTAHNISYSDDYTSIVKLVVDNDMVSKQQFQDWFEQENLHIWDKEELFKNYKVEKKPLYTKYKDLILGFDFKIQILYITLACDSEEEAYEFFVKNKDKFELSYYDNGSLITSSDNCPLNTLVYYKNWDVLRGYIKFIDKYNPIKENSLVFVEIKNILDKAPQDILEWYQNYVDVDTLKSIEYEVLEAIMYKNLDVILQKFKNKTTILNVSNKYAKTLLHNACDYKNLTKIHKLLDLGLSVNIQDKYNKTPLDSFLKAKPDEKDEEHFEMFKTLLRELLKEGGKPSEDSIKPIKAKKYKAYHELLNDYSEISNEIEKEDELEELKQEQIDNELVEVEIYRTEVTTHYHRYKTTVQIPRKDLVLEDDDIVNDYYDYADEEYDSDWDSSANSEWEIIK